MRPRTCGAALLALLLHAAPAGDGALAEPSGEQGAPSPFALVELFTSEGCSSCPAADRVLSELVAEANRERLPVYALSFHVDYWNALGWKDPWSDAAWSKRQSSYVRGLEPRYTPQMIVNGTEKFVGSDRDRARRSIAASLASPAAVALEARLVPAAADAGLLRVAWQVDPVPREARLHIALAERRLASRVTRGENHGRTLVHDNVVRALQSLEISAAGRGESTIDPPADTRLERSSVILFVQDPRTLEVLGAAGIDAGGTTPVPSASRP